MATRGNKSPRAIIRQEVVDLLSERLPEIPVYDTYVRDFKKGLTRFISVFSPDEYRGRPEGEGEGRRGRPMNRQISIVIVVCVQQKGDGVEAADVADTLSRDIEIILNDEFSAMEPEQITTDFEAGEVISCLIEMSYSVEYHDNMAPDRE